MNMWGGSAGPHSIIASKVWIYNNVELIEPIVSCRAGCSAPSWSRPPRGTAPLPSEGRQRASMSRPWERSEYSDPSDWSLEYPVSSRSRGKKEKKEGDKKIKGRSEDQVWAMIGWGGGGMNRRLGPILVLDATRKHAATQKHTHTHRLSCCQILTVDELSFSLSALETAQINNPTEPDRKGSDIVNEACAGLCSCVCVCDSEQTHRLPLHIPHSCHSVKAHTQQRCSVFRLNTAQHRWTVCWIGIMATDQ